MSSHTLQEHPLAQHPSTSDELQSLSFQLSSDFNIPASAAEENGRNGTEQSFGEYRVGSKAHTNENTSVHI